MNKLEKEILESEMGLYSKGASDKDALDAEDARNAEDTPEDGELEDVSDKDSELLDMSAVQLKIDDEYLGKEESDEMLKYGYQEKLDLSSLSSDEETEPVSETKKEQDCARLYQETAHLLETGEIDISDGISLLKKNASDGHAMSWVYLGQLYSNKSGGMFNPAMAFECYKNASDADLGEGHYDLGLCYISGFGCDKDDERAAECFSAGARKLNADCICALGMCYEFGQGCDVNYEYAVTLYEKGYELGHPTAANNFGGCLFHGNGIKKDTERAISVYKEAAMMGSSNALCRLGEIYEAGRAAERDIKAAFEYYKASADSKNPIGLYSLARCYKDGVGVKQDLNKAFKYYNRSAMLGYDPAKYEAGQMSLKGLGTKKNYGAAYKYFVSAAECGFAAAEFEAAKCLFDGTGAMKDRERAYMYYCSAYESDEKNRANAAYRIGLCHLRGFGAEKDEGLAFEWFLTGAKLKDPNALYMLGECYYFGVGTSVDEACAADCFIRAEEIINESGADKNEYVSLLMSLALCFEKGIGTAADPKRARSIYKAASESGRPDALFQMGRAAVYGIGMKAEYPAARQYFLRSARSGYAPAMLMMGIFSDEGRGVAQNKSDAQSWYLKTVNAEGLAQISAYDFPDRFSEGVKAHTEAKIKAQYKLGMLIASSDKTVKGYTEAFGYIALSASMGYTQAQTEIARIYALGGDLTQYFEDPQALSDRSGEAGDMPPDKNVLSEAMNKLGDTFFDGKHSLKKNEVAAARCYRFASELGNTDACYSYGWCLRHGVGVRENDAEAVKWLKMAADRGNANAAYSYGLCCEEGSGTGVRNRREALYYYRMAANSGHGDAAERFVTLSERDE